MEINLAQAKYTSESTQQHTSTSFLYRLARYVVYIGIALIPFSFSTFTFDVFEFNKQALLFFIVAIAGTFYLVDVVRSGKFYLRKNSFYLPLIIVWFTALITTIFSKSSHSSLFGVGDARIWSLLTISLLVFGYFLYNTLSLNKARYVIGISLLLAMLFGIAQLLGIFILKFKFPSLSNRAFNTFGSINNLGFIASIALPLFWGGALAFTNKKINALIQWVGVAVSLAILVLINWWPLWLVASAGLLVAMLASIVRTRKLNTRSFIIPLTIIVVALLCSWTHFSLSSIRNSLPIEVLPNQKASYSIDWSVIKKNPLGYGLSNFSIAFDQFKPKEIANSLFYSLRFDNSASAFTTVIAETGILGLLASLYLLVLIIHLFITKGSSSIKNDPSLVGVWAGIASLVVGFFLYPFSISFIVLFLILLFSVSQRTSCSLVNLDESNAYSFVGSLVFISFLVVALVAGYIEVNMIASNVYLAKAGKASSSDVAIQYFVKSINTDKTGDRGYRMLSSYALQSLANTLKNGPAKGESKDAYNTKVQNYLSSAIDLSIKSTELNPADAQNWMNRGYIYQNLIGLVGGADASAITMYKESLARNPNDPLAYVRIGNVYLSISENAQAFLKQSKDPKTDVRAIQQEIVTNLDLAQQNFEKAITLNNNFGQALYNLAVVYEHKGQLKQSIAQFQKLYTQNPNDPSILFQLGLLYYRNNEKDNALAAWQRAVTLFPNYANARWYLSLVYEERGDLDNALAQVIEIEKFNKDNDLVEQRLAQLQAGKRLIPPEKVLDQKPL